MTHKIDFFLASSTALENELGSRIEAIRLSRNITQSRLAEDAGVSRSTITRLTQVDKGISLDSFLRIMQALGLHGHLELLLPDPSISPLEALEARKAKRQRARPKSTSARNWAWNDDEMEV